MRKGRGSGTAGGGIGAGAAIVIAAVVVISIAERFRPLRKRRESPARHVARDAAMALMSTAATMVTQSVILRPALRRLKRRGPFGLIAGVLLLDYSLWIWHWLNHRVDFLWRFHRVHHVDLDLDAATGARFHFGEMSFSTLYRWLQIRIIDPDPRALSIWQTMLLVSIFFHHSNTRLNEEVDRALSHVVVTPRMHGIHHSIVRRETDSNFASLFTLWDMLHGKFLIDVPQQTITIGVPAYQKEEDVTLQRLIVLPVRNTEGDWRAKIRD